MSLTANLISEFSQPGVLDISGAAKFGYASEQNSLNLGMPMPPADLVQSKLIQVDQQVDIYFQWQVKGTVAHALNPAFRWEIELFFERYGGLEFSLPNPKITLVYGNGNLVVPDEVNFPGTGPGGLSATTISIPPNTVPAGVYDVVAVIRMLHQAGDNTPCFLAAFAEFGKINFYQEH